MIAKSRNRQFLKHLFIYNMYTIITTEFQYGQIILQKEAEEVKATCEEMRKHFGNVKEDIYCRIEVVNNDTGEIREYWNNKQNETLF